MKWISTHHEWCEAWFFLTGESWCHRSDEHWMFCLKSMPPLYLSAEEQVLIANA